MKVLVTGASGFIGTHLCKELASLGFEVIGTNFRSLNTHARFQRERLVQLSDHGVVVVDCDLTDAESFEVLRAHDDISAVVHLAGKPGVRLSVEDIPDYASANLTALSRVLDFVIEREIDKFIFASSSTVYESSGADAAFNESLEIKTPSNFYGLSKMIGESMVTSRLSVTTTSYVLARFFSVYGPLGRSDMAYQRAIDSAYSGKPFLLNGDGTQLRDFTYVKDVVTILIESLSRDIESGPLNFGGGNPRTVSDLLIAVEHATGRKITLEKAESSSLQSKELQRTNSSFARLEALGFSRPQIGLEAGILECVRVNNSLNN